MFISNAVIKRGNAVARKEPSPKCLLITGGGLLVYCKICNKLSRYLVERYQIGKFYAVICSICISRF